jgi:predicted ATPase
VQFQHTLDWTRRQAILSMELRCATGLSRLWHEQGRTEAARDLLESIYGRFTEGFATNDLRAARSLIGSLA